MNVFFYLETICVHKTDNRIFAYRILLALNIIYWLLLPYYNRYHDSDDFYALHGELDETQLYNCALDEEAIKAAAAGRAGTIAVTEANKDCLMHWFRYNSNTGNTVENEIDIDRNGVIIDILGDQVFRADSSSLPA